MKQYVCALCGWFFPRTDVVNVNVNREWAMSEYVCFSCASGYDKRWTYIADIVHIRRIREFYEYRSRLL